MTSRSALLARRPEPGQKPGRCRRRAVGTRTPATCRSSARGRYARILRISPARRADRHSRLRAISGAAAQLSSRAPSDPCLKPGRRRSWLRPAPSRRPSANKTRDHAGPPLGLGGGSHPEPRSTRTVPTRGGAGGGTNGALFRGSVPAVAGVGRAAGFDLAALALDVAHRRAPDLAALRGVTSSWRHARIWRPL